MKNSTILISLKFLNLLDSFTKRTIINIIPFCLRNRNNGLSCDAIVSIKLRKYID